MSGRATLTAFLLAIVAGLPEAGATNGQPPDDAAGDRIAGQPITLVYRDLSAPVPVMAARRRAVDPQARPGTARALSVLRPPHLSTRHRAAEPGGDPLLLAQKKGRAAFPAATTPAPLVNFPGLDADTSAGTPFAGRVAPPDTVGAAGPDFYVQMINLIFTVYDKDGSICGAAGASRPTAAHSPPATSGTVSVAPARARTTAIRSFSTTTWPTAGCSASSRSSAAWTAPTSA